jgi:hypothetical protein
LFTFTLDVLILYRHFNFQYIHHSCAFCPVIARDFSRVYWISWNIGSNPLYGIFFPNILFIFKLRALLKLTNVNWKTHTNSEENELNLFLLTIKNNLICLSRTETIKWNKRVRFLTLWVNGKVKHADLELKYTVWSLDKSAIWMNISVF